MARKNTGFDLEQALRELESLVNKMEAGELSLDESLKHFERGVALTRACQKALSEAEQRVKILLEKNGTQALTPFAPGAGDNDGL
ncbi:MAG: exodeoxyribonuclease VII small subunit [Chromatiales bacterium]